MLADCVVCEGYDERELGVSIGCDAFNASLIKELLHLLKGMIESPATVGEHVRENDDA